MTSAIRRLKNSDDQPPSVNAITQAWADRVIKPTREALSKLTKAKITDLITGTFPEPSSSEILQLTSDWTTLFCCLDDYLESFNDVSKLRAYLDELWGIYEGRQTPEADVPFGLGMADIGERIRELTPQLASEFSRRLKVLFDGFTTEAGYSTTKVHPKLAHYFANRKITVGVQTGFILGLGIQNIDFPLELLNHPIIKFIEEQACLIIGLENDLRTVQREIEKGEVNNAVIILISQGATLENATSRIHRHIRKKEAKLLVAEAILPYLDFSPEVEVKVKAYIDIIKAYVESHRTWAANTGRYDRV